MATKDDIQRAAAAPVIETRKRDVPNESPGTDALPPPGHGRDEVLRMRNDQLQELIEKKAEAKAFGLLDPRVLQPDNEIAAGAHEMTDITNAKADRHYCWVECGIRDTQTSHVHRKQMEGFRFVDADDPECPDVPRNPSGHRRLGTAVLMWCPIERWIDIRSDEHALALRQRGDMNNGDRLLEIAQSHGVKVNVIGNWNQLSPEAQQMAYQRFAIQNREREKAYQRIDRQLRDGTAHLNYGNQRRSML